MCGRYVLSSPGEVVADHFRLDETPELSPRYNIAPTQEVPIVRADADGGRRARPARWGLVPGWSVDTRDAARRINARAETLAVKPSFKWSYRHRRCLVPADGFFEWRASGRAKLPFLFRPLHAPLVAFAGLWDRWGEGDGRFDSFTIVTTDANAEVAEVHDRMPVLLEPSAFDTWLAASELDRPTGEALLTAAPDGTLEAIPVSTLVNNPRHDEPACVEPEPLLF